MSRNQGLRAGEKGLCRQPPLWWAGIPLTQGQMSFLVGKGKRAERRCVSRWLLDL